MPVNIVAERCSVCDAEITVYARAASCGHATVICLSASYLGCEEGKAPEQPEAPELRDDEAMAGAGNEPFNVVCEKEEKHHEEVSEHTPGPWIVDGRPENQIVWSSAEDRVCFSCSQQRH